MDVCCCLQAIWRRWGKNLTLFQTLRKEKAARAKAIGNTEVSNLQDSLVDVHVHGRTKRKAELPARPGKGKDMKKVRALCYRRGRLVVPKDQRLP